MSFLRSKHSGWGPDGRRTPFMGGGGGGGQPTQTTSYSTNVPEYARPYVENMLESTQKQIYTDDMAGFRPYKPYSTDVNQYFAGFSPMQQQAQQATANLQTPGQYGTATGLAGASGLGAFGAAQQAIGAGQQFAQQAQDPRAMQGYMSPYMQNVVDYQKTQALRDYQMAAPMRARAAIGAGAFGGSRQAIESAEAQRNLMGQLQGISATGSQKAFEDAQRQQQFGAQLGMQGLQTGLQGYGQMGQAASTLGQLGGQQLGAQKEIIGLQSQMGKEQQALEQNKINQAIQDYAIAQQYPFMQLGMMNAMLRGLPLQTQTTQLYQAQPSMLQQGIGLAGAGASLFGGGGRAAGGAIKEYRQGGIVGYAPGGVIDSTRAQLEQIADMPGGVQKLEQIRNSSTSDEVRKMAAEVIIEKQMEAQAEQQTQKARMSGIAMAGGPAFESQGMAGGGIIAFQNGGYTNEELEEMARGQGVFAEGSAALPGQGLAAAPAPQAKAAEKKEGTEKKSDRSVMFGGPKNLAEALAERQAVGPKGQFGEEFEKFLGDYVGDPDRLSRKERMAAAKGFLKFASTPAPGGIMQAAAAGLGEYATGVESARDAEDKVKFETAKIKSDLEKARRAELRGDVDASQKYLEGIAERESRLKVAQMQLAKSSDFERKYALYAESEKAAGRTPSYEGFVRTTSLQDDTAKMTANRKAVEAFTNAEAMQFGGDKQYRDLKKAAQKGDEAAVQAFNNYRMQKFREIHGMMLDPEKAIGGGAGVPQGVIVKKVG
jgi:hypothetical protein